MLQLFDDYNYFLGYRYSIRNCLYEAVIENIISNCKCLPSYPELYYYESMPFCRAENLTCAIRWLNSMGDDDHDPDMVNMTLTKITVCCAKEFK